MRKHNKVNEIDSDDDHLPDPIDPDTITEGQGQTAWVVPGYDAAGNPFDCVPVCRDSAQGKL